METESAGGQNRNYHRPVMLSECIEALRIRPEGVYVDVTFGGGGHSIAILEQLKGGHLYAFDQDEDAQKQAATIQGSSFTFCKANFRNLKEVLNQKGVHRVDGILADLGISSHQIDQAQRGFSTRFEGPLDMRMNRSARKTAADILNTADEADLHKIFGMYGEIKNARTAARLVVNKRSQPFKTTFDLKDALGEIAPRGKENKWFAQVFQALRIEVNDELKALEEFLIQCGEVITPGGRLVVMSYHSLEDRMVKNYISTGKIYGEVEKDFYGNQLRPFEAVIRKPIVASEDEIAENSRARSARLRVAERTETQVIIRG
jgi:16S rRNA (cytosine1402-N4)-methyltransferase